MKSPTDMLLKEHENILKFIDFLLEKCEVMEKKKEIDRDFFERAIDFIRNYADKFHHAKEEDLLFKELCKDTVEMHCNPVEQMLYEHNLGRDFVKGIEDGLKKSDINKVIKNCKDYLDNTIRYFRVTGYISLRGGGFYIDLEKSRDSSISAL